MSGAEPSLVEKILRLDEALEAAGIGHAFGGALALAYYTADPRATADIDLNIQLASSEVDVAFAALPVEITRGDAERARVALDEQVRLWWGRTPIDLFFRAASFHVGVAERTARHPFAGRLLPFISANDLAVLKALFDRPKDWVDIGAMHDHGAIDLRWVATTLDELVGDDHRVHRVSALEFRPKRDG